MSASAEADVKETIKRAGGFNNQSGLFLSPTSTATAVNSKTGKIQRSVSYIPRCSMPTNLLEAIDKGK